jgi:hypothetical protein
MIKIYQGKPTTNRFKVFVPPTLKIKRDDEILCINPHNKKATKGIVYGIMTENWLKIPDWICYETYDLNAAEIKKLLEQKFPEHRNQDYVKILLIRQTK